MTSFKTIWKCMFSPRLYRIYHRGSNNGQYDMTTLEKYGDNVISTIKVISNVGLHASPIILFYLYTRNYFMQDGLLMLLKFSSTIGAIYAMSMYIRGWGRASHVEYLRFLDKLEECQTNMTYQNKKELQKYDFDFYAWPLEFYAERRARSANMAATNSQLTFGQQIVTLPFEILAYFAIHSFGIRLIYPGMILIIQTLLATNLSQGRARLVQAFKGQRYKIQTEDKNHIDTMFIDNRGETANGHTLFVCSEGNAGFYEIGIMCTPIDAGYSVLGWNHPGFACSTGKPYPDQEQNAIDAVMQLATKKLGFMPENIVLYGWSIGGYATSWVSMLYPNVKAVILDASFDDILPLAEQHMPQTLSPVVKIAIRKHVNLCNARYLKQYAGSILLIRRSEDEVICTEEQNISTNRGNFLLLEILRARYPLLLKDPDQIAVLNEFLSLTGTQQDTFMSKYDVNNDECSTLLRSYIIEYSKSYPMQIGQDMLNETRNKLILYLARKYFKDYKSTHCTPLPVEFLSQVWDS